MAELNALELAVMRKLLSGDHAILGALRRQFEMASPGERELTGAGFLVHFKVGSEAPRLPFGPPNFELGDVTARIDGLEHGAGFLLFVRGGVLATLEGFCYDEPWPLHAGGFELRYEASLPTGIDGFSRS